jgi:putative tryptophan/tyrosine transport system substrate-binding protein
VSEAESIDALTDALREAGWHAGTHYTLVMPPPSSEEAKLAANMHALLDSHVDLVVAQTKPAARVAVKATRDAPIVLGAFNGNPAQEGIVASLERPGGNVTGTYYLGRVGIEQRFTLLRELVPGLASIGVLMNSRSAFSGELAQQTSELGKQMGFDTRVLGAGNAADVERTYAEAAAAGVDGVATVTGADMYALREQIAKAAWKHRVPTVMGSIGFAELGGLAKLGPDIPVLWRKMAAAHVIPILSGARPGDLPMIGLEEFELVINLATAAHLGLSVADTLKARAVKLVEHAFGTEYPRLDARRESPA